MMPLPKVGGCVAADRTERVVAAWRSLRRVAAPVALERVEGVVGGVLSLPDGPEYLITPDPRLEERDVRSHSRQGVQSNPALHREVVRTAERIEQGGSGRCPLGHRGTAAGGGDRADVVGRENMHAGIGIRRHRPCRARTLLRGRRRIRQVVGRVNGAAAIERSVLVHVQRPERNRLGRNAPRHCKNHNAQKG